jgi:hypothetical protein
MVNNKHGVPDPVPCGKKEKARKGKKDNDPFYEHTILLEPLVVIYIDHVIRITNGCLVLNPESHLRLHDNLEGGELQRHQFCCQNHLRKIRQYIFRN